MQQQIDMSELLSVMMGRIALLGQQCEELQKTVNILARINLENGTFTREKIFNSVKKEYEVLKELGGVDAVPSDDDINAMVENMIATVSGDVDKVKEMVRRHEELLKKRMNEKKIETADASVLNALDNAKKLIL